MNFNKLSHILSRTPAQAAALVARFERRYGCSYDEWLRVKWGKLGLGLDGESEMNADPNDSVSEK